MEKNNSNNETDNDVKPTEKTQFKVFLKSDHSDFKTLMLDSS